MMKFGDIECKRWSQMKKLVWKRMANATKEFLQDNPESNPGVSREKRRLVPQHVADDVGNAKPFNMLEARDFFATEMTRASLNVAVPFMPVFRQLMEQCKSQLASAGTIELRPLVEHVLTAIDSTFKVAVIDMICKHMDSGANTTEMGVLFPIADSQQGNGIDNEYAASVLQLRTSMTYHMLHELTLSTKHKVFFALGDLGHRFTTTVSANETTLKEFEKRHCFWTAVWIKFGMLGYEHHDNVGELTRDLLRVVSESHNLASGNHMPAVPDEVAQGDDDKPVADPPLSTGAQDILEEIAELIESTPRRHSTEVTQPHHEAFSTSAEFLGNVAKSLFPEDKQPVNGLSLDEIGRMHIIQSHVCSAIMTHGLKAMNCNGISLQRTDDDNGVNGMQLTLPASQCDKFLCVPFLGRVVWNEGSVPKFTPRIKLGNVFGADLFLIPDDDYPCVAWSVPTSVDAAECNVKSSRQTLVVTMPWADDSGKQTCLSIDTVELIGQEQLVLGGMSNTVAATKTLMPVVLVRQVVPEDPNHVKKTIESSMGQLKLHVHGIYGSEQEAQPSGPAGRVKLNQRDIPADLQHVLL